MKKIISIILVLLSIMTFSGGLTVSAYTKDTIENVVSENVLSEENVQFLLESNNLNNAILQLNNVALESKDDNTKVRSIKITDDLILEEEITIQEIQNKSISLMSTTTSRQVTSKVTLKNNIGLTAAELTAIGYFTYNGSTCYAYDADTASSVGILYTCSDYVSYIGSTPVSGYARVSGKYNVKGSVDIEWANLSVGELNIVANVFCNQDGDYFSQWN